MPKKQKMLSSTPVRLDTKLLNQLREHSERTHVPITTLLSRAVTAYLAYPGNAAIDDLLARVETLPNSKGRR